MMNASLSIQPPRWVMASLALGMALAMAGLASMARVAIQPALTARTEMTARSAQIQPNHVPAAQTSVAKPRLPVVKPVSRDPRFKKFKLACGCTVDYADNCSPPCRIWFADGSVMSFDHLYRASSAPGRVGQGQLMQFGYDEQDRVCYARYDPESAVYYFNKDGSLRNIVHSLPGGRNESIHPAFKVEKGVRTRYPHQLSHPHVPSDSAMGRVFAGTWKAYEK